MSDKTAGTPWGKCEAYGCPLAGSLGRGDMWVCLCHHEASSGAFQGITKAIRDHEYLANATLDIRRYFGSDDWPAVYRQIQRRFIEANRRDLLLGNADCSPHDERRPVVRLWLMRLEFELLRLTQSGSARRAAPPTPTAPVAGPSHVADFIDTNTGENHGA